MLAVRGVITGLNASTTGGWHIHTGFTCDVASYVGGHYYLGGTPDSWKGITYTADSNGVADITTFLPGFSLAGGPLGVNGHSVVIHNSYYCSRQIQPMPPSLSCCTVTLRDALSHSVMHCHTPCCTVTLCDGSLRDPHAVLLAHVVRDGFSPPSLSSSPHHLLTPRALLHPCRFAAGLAHASAAVSSSRRAPAPL